MPKVAKKTETQPEQAITPVITSLEDLQKICTSRKKVEFTIDDKKCELEVRRLTPAETFHVSEVIESVIPPVVKGKTPEDDRIDTLNPSYLKSKAVAVRNARALGLYLAVPALNAAKPGLTDVNAIAEFVQGQLTEDVLTVLWNGVQQSGVSVAELVNLP